MTALLYGLNARTSIAAGTGQNLGTIDLPIMREAPTGYPVIFGSALKGAMRAKMEKDVNENVAKWVFGDDAKGGSEYAGALIVSDARILLLPVRSMTTHFKLVTCPYVLERFKKDALMVGKKLNWNVPTVGEEEVLVVAGGEDKLYLEEYALSVEKKNLDAVIEALAKVMDEGAEEVLKQQLVIVSDSMFGHLSQFATPVNAHIKINNANKTVQKGALWYEESLPPETVLYSVLIANSARDNSGNDRDATKAQMRALLHGKYLQVGGNETVGMGWCKGVCYE
ncbi:type III-B CRISPR module RAMP protein Cmr4 [Sulfurospirillum sp. T05]|uniref:Type III-B CRISPR module RAMP protein Cmr4 n=1 Tax=Sulfurospirillum tamanense TaxID=2813362 RepID=A0ABS2WUR3_9BACT|nr:type III-B CRISPR module RAMP protein Cmr4 [Sulfurospirillum tamanensis]MBN2965380.1 type III-B CRISPR module RAMP protein Cmr4 [Sulfurospirillum tamanensis]